MDQKLPIVLSTILLFSLFVQSPAAETQPFSKPTTNDFYLNDDAGTAVQETPAIAMTPGGYTVACWTDRRNGNEDIYFQIAGNVGYPVKTNQKANNDVGTTSQRAPAIAINACGQFVIAWQDARNGNSDIYAQRFAANGAPLGSNFKVNDDVTTQPQQEAAVAMDSVGNFIVCWADHRAGGTYLIYAQRYDARGMAMGHNFQVDADGGIMQAWPAIDMNATGQFVITWMESLSPSVTDIFGLVFNRDGTRVTPVFEVSTHPGQTTWTYNPDVAIKSDDEFMIAWYYAISGGHFNVYARAYHANATAYGDPFIVNQTGGPDENTQPALAAVNRLNIYDIVWNSNRNGTSDIWHRFYEANGTPRSNGIYINDAAGSQRNAQLACDARGIYLYVWEDDRRGNSDIYACWNGTSRPLNVTVGTGYNGCVPISWSHRYQNDATITYVIHRGLAPGGEFATIATINPATRPFPKLMLDYVDDTAVNGTTYYYAIEPGIPLMDFSDVVKATPNAHGHVLASKWSAHTVTIDGQIRVEEWGDARIANIANPFAPEPVLLYLKNDNTTLFIAVDDPNDLIVDPANILYFIFDQDNDNRWDPSGMVTEGALAINNAAVAYSGYYGDYPDHFNVTAAVVPTGVQGDVSAANGHVQYEMSVNLNSSPLTARPGDLIGAYIFVDDPGSFYPEHKGNPGEWPPGALYDAAETLGQIQLANEPDPASTNLNWPMAQGGRGGQSWAISETQLQPPFAYSAEFATRSEYTGYLACVDNILYASIDGYPNRLIAFDVKSQTELWRFIIPFTGGDCYCNPAVNDSLVFIGGQAGSGLYALNRWTGEQKWLKPIGSLFRHHPVPDGDYVYIINIDSLLCVRAKDGATVWSFPVDGQVTSSYTPVVDEERIFVMANQELWALNKLTGDPIWHVPNHHRSVVADADAVYGIYNNEVIARSKHTGAKFWSYAISDMWMDYMPNAFAVSDDAVCFSVTRNAANGTAALYVLEKSTGAHRWHYPFPGKDSFFPMIANNTVYGVYGAYGQGDGDGSLWGFDLATGAVRLTDNTVRYSRYPIVAGHTLFVPSNGVIRAFSNQTVAVNPGESNAHPSRFALHQNYPNPFNPATQITYQVPKSSFVTLTIYNIRGEIIRTLVNEYQTAEQQSVVWDGLDQQHLPVSSGLYFYRIRSDDFSAVKKMLLVR